MVKIIPISSLEPLKSPLRDPLDLRDRLDRYSAALVASLVKALTEGAEVPAVTVFEVAGKRVLVDGRHRLRAHQEAGRTEIAADLIPVRSPEEGRTEAIKLRLRQRQETFNQELDFLSRRLSLRLPGKK